VVAVKEQVTICRNLVAFYNRSSNFQKVLKQQQQLINAPENGLIQVLPN
jgi:hypothetical protein